MGQLKPLNREGQCCCQSELTVKMADPGVVQEGETQVTKQVLAHFEGEWDGLGPIAHRDSDRAHHDNFRVYITIKIFSACSGCPQWKELPNGRNI